MRTSSCQVTRTITSPGLGTTTTMADRTFDVKSSSVKRLCHFVIATAYNKQIPQICHWLIDQEQVDQRKKSIDIEEPFVLLNRTL